MLAQFERREGFGDAEAAKRFKQVQAAYDVLRKAEERRDGQAA